MTESKKYDTSSTRLLVAAGLALSTAWAAGASAAEQGDVALSTANQERAVVLLVDRSPSMVRDSDPSLAGLLDSSAEAAPAPFTKWENVVDAVATVSKAARSGEPSLQLSVGYFPEATACGAPIDSTPTAEVQTAEPWAPSGGSPGAAGPTSMLGAIESGAKFCRDLEARSPGAQCGIVLVTDGGADSCDSADAAKAVARVAALKAAGIRTQVLGISGADLPTLEVIARAGGAAEWGGDSPVAVRASAGGLPQSLSRAMERYGDTSKTRQESGRIARVDL